MISAKALYYGNKNTIPLLQTDEREAPVGVQIFGSEPELMGQMAHKIEDRGFAFIDINMGCPVPKIVNNHEGSALMKQPELAGRIVSEVKRAVSLPVTVKFRLGFDEEHRERRGVREGSRGQRRGCSGGPRQDQRAVLQRQRRTGTPSGRSKEAVRVPVIANGDVYSGADALAIREQTGLRRHHGGPGQQGQPVDFPGDSGRLLARRAAAAGAHRPREGGHAPAPRRPLRGVQGRIHGDPRDAQARRLVYDGASRLVETPPGGQSGDDPRSAGRFAAGTVPGRLRALAAGVRGAVYHTGAERNLPWNCKVPALTSILNLHYNHGLSGVSFL